jgi:Asp-tRNA(Asn)/Glu-tRNA(Gln) amidotransferase A subunit family amidase
LKTAGDGSLLGSRDGVAVSAALRAGELTCRELAAAFLAASDGDELGAWAAIDADALLARAARLDRLGTAERARLPLFGLPIGVKDNFDTAGLPTAYGSPIYARHRPPADAEAVRRLVAAGAIVAGKTTCSEFAWMSPADTLNPLDRSRTPGGSSSGSAAAVASGTVPIATGTQTAGSINRPASYCGVIGYKPSFQAFPRAGVRLLSPALDTVGLLARSVRDIRLAAWAIASPDDSEPVAVVREPSHASGVREPGYASGVREPGYASGVREPGRAPRLALARTPAWGAVEPAARAAIEDVALAAWDAGACLEDLELPDRFEELVAAHKVIQEVESAASLAGELALHGDLLSESLRAALADGAAIPPDRYARAKRTAAVLGRVIAGLLAGYDGVLTPSATGTPPLGLGFTGDPRFCRAWTLIGAPTISIPVAWTPGRLPVGLQVVGAPGRDGRTLAAAEWLLDRLAPMTNRV